MHNYNELKVWKKSIDLTYTVYQELKEFPSEEKFGLISQFRRCAVSIPSNIAEGSGRNSDKELIHFLGIANGSAFELETQLIISEKLNYLSKEALDKMRSELTEIQKMIYGFIQKLKS